MSNATNRSGYLVGTAWLAQHLHDPDLRIFDCSVRLIPDPAVQYRVEDCRADYEAGHIPGAAYIDLHNDLSDKNTALRFMMPPPAQFEQAMSRFGVQDGVRVILYGKGTYYWATRIWWMLRAHGFENAALLDGGWQKWTAEERPVTTGAETYPPGRFVPRPRPGLFCGKDEVLAALHDPHTRVVNALTPEQHAGTGGTSFGRLGHIAGSVNVPGKELVDPNTNTLLPPERLRARFAGAGVLDRDRTIVYCGGGISATGTAFALTLLGRDQVSVYDGSLNEWGPDQSLPMTTGS